MAFYPIWAAAVLAWHYGTPTLAYPEYCPNGVATLDIQPIKILTKIPVFVSTYVEQNTDLVIDKGHTFHVTKAPTNVVTVITITNTGRTTTSSLEPGQPGKSTKSKTTPPPNIKTTPEQSGGPLRSSQTKGPNTTGLINSNTGKPSSVKLSSAAGSQASSKPYQSSAPPASSSGVSSAQVESSSKPATSKAESSKSPSSQSAISVATSSSKAPSSSQPTSSMPVSSQAASSQPASSSAGASSSAKASSATISSALASSAPASSAPASSTPVSSAPTSSAPASSAPASSAPASSAPASSSPASSAPASSAPVSSAPVSSAPASSAPASSAPASSAPASSAPASSTKPKPSSACPSAAPTATVCATGLPSACTKLGSVNGVQLITEILGCTTALGPFAVGDLSKCLLTGGLNPLSKGQTIVNCLLDAIGTACLTKLPDACTSLSGASGASLVTKVASCTLQLGPFAVDNTLQCLTKGLTQGDDIIACLLNALGLPESGGGGSDTCSAGPQACVSKLPPDCNVLSDLVGTDIIPKLVGCTAALGTYAVGAATTCLNPATILGGTLGSGIVSCLLDALSGVCIQALPGACSNLISVSQGQLTTEIPKCLAALGPFASGGVVDCITPNLGSGQDVVSCISKALFGSDMSVNTRRRRRS